MAVPVILLVLSICGGVGANFFTKHPEDTLAVAGQNVTLSCTATIPYCDYIRGKGYALHWTRIGARMENSDVLSLCTQVYPRYDNKYEISSRNNEWTLHIYNVTQQNDGEQYWCQIFVFTNQERFDSKVAALTVVRSTNTVVKPSRPSREEGGTVTFHCRTEIQSMDTLLYAWYINGTMREHPMPGRFQLSDNGQILTIRRLNMKFNNTEVACKLFRGSVLLTNQSESALLLVYPKEEPTEFNTDTEIPLTGTFTSDGRSDTHGTVAVKSPTEASPADEADLPSDIRPPSLPPSCQSSTKKGDPDFGLAGKPYPESEGNPFVITTILGWTVAAVLLIIVVALLVYFLTFKDRSKAKSGPRCDSRTTADDGTYVNAARVAETQLNDLGETASTSRARTPKTAKGTPAAGVMDLEHVYEEPDKHRAKNP